MTEEDILIQQFGRRNPFTVPDGYFDRFAADMMEKLAEQPPVAMPTPRRAMLRRLFPYSAAAAVVGVLFGVGIYLSGRPTAESDALASVQDYTIDQIADYAMIDNQDLYTYIADEY